MFFENLKHCFNINLNEYSNIGINLQINKVLLPAFIAFGVLMVLLAVYRKNMRDLVMQLMRHEAYSEDSACTLEDLGLGKSRVILYLLSHSDILKKVVERTDRIKYTYEEYKKLTKAQKKECERIDFSVAKFYIPEESMDRARHVKEKYLFSKTQLIVACVFLVLVYVALAVAMPEILNLINNLLKAPV